MDIAEFLLHRHIPFELVAEKKSLATLSPREAIATKGRHVARTVLLRTPDGYLIAIFPFAYKLNLGKLEMLVGARPILPTSQAEFAELFPDCLDGLVPPMGSPYGIRTVMDIHLSGCASILFTGPEGRGGVRMDREDYDQLENPIRGCFADPPEE